MNGYINSLFNRRSNCKINFLFRSSARKWKCTLTIISTNLATWLANLAWSNPIAFWILFRQILWANVHGANIIIFKTLIAFFQYQYIELRCSDFHIKNSFSTPTCTKGTIIFLKQVKLPSVELQEYIDIQLEEIVLEFQLPCDTVLLKGRNSYCMTSRTPSFEVEWFVQRYPAFPTTGSCWIPKTTGIHSNCSLLKKYLASLRIFYATCTCSNPMRG